MNIKKLHFLILCTFLLLFSFAPPVFACRAPRSSPEKLISEAEVIIRAVAVKYIRDPGDLRRVRALQEPSYAEIEFRVKEVLKGEYLPATLALNGYLTDTDDYNDQPVPYDFVRKGGRGGSCSAYEYKQGAEFLLFLKKKDGKFTIRWYALAPTNEQLRGKDDKWLIWVKNHLKTSKEKEIED